MSLCVKADRLQNAGHQTQNSKNFLQTSDKKAAGIILPLFVVEDCRGEAECSLFAKDKNAKASKRKACKTQLLSGEKGGPACDWWIVDSSM